MTEYSLTLILDISIVFKRPTTLHFHMPPAIEETEQLHCVKLFGVLFQDNLKMDSHIQYILSQCAQRMSFKVVAAPGYATE